MFIYLAIFIIIAICGYLEVIRIEFKVKQILIFFAFVLLAFFAGLRGEIGYDYDTYEEIFQLSGEATNWLNYKKDLPDLHVEPGFVLLAAIFNYFHLSFNFFLLFFACLTLLCLYITQRKYSPYILVGLLIYLSRFYHLREFGQIRAGLAILILLYGTTYLYEGRKLKYFLFILIGFLFHSIALLGLIFFFFYRIKLTNKIFYALIGGAFLLGAINWLNLLMPLFERIFPATLYTAYFIWDQYAFPLGLTNPVLLAQTAFVIFFYHKREILTPQVRYYDVVLKAYLFSTLWLAAFNRIAVIAGRTSTVYATFEIIIVPAFLLLIKEKHIAYILIVLYAMVIYVLNLSKVLDVYVPYKTFFS